MSAAIYDQLAKDLKALKPEEAGPKKNTQLVAAAARALQREPPVLRTTPAQLVAILESLRPALAAVGAKAKPMDLDEQRKERYRIWKYLSDSKLLPEVFTPSEAVALLQLFNGSKLWGSNSQDQFEVYKSMNVQPRFTYAELLQRLLTCVRHEKIHQHAAEQTVKADTKNTLLPAQAVDLMRCVAWSEPEHYLLRVLPSRLSEPLSVDQALVLRAHFHKPWDQMSFWPRMMEAICKAQKLELPMDDQWEELSKEMPYASSEVAKWKKMLASTYQDPAAVFMAQMNQGKDPLQELFGWMRPQGAPADASGPLSFADVFGGGKPKPAESKAPKGAVIHCQGSCAEKSEVVYRVEPCAHIVCQRCGGGKKCGECSQPIEARTKLQAVQR